MMHPCDILKCIGILQVISKKVKGWQNCSKTKEIPFSRFVLASSVTADTFKKNLGTPFISGHQWGHQCFLFNSSNVMVDLDKAALEEPGHRITHGISEILVNIYISVVYIHIECSICHFHGRSWWSVMKAWWGHLKNHYQQCWPRAGFSIKLWKCNFNRVWSQSSLNCLLQIWGYYQPEIKLPRSQFHSPNALQ